MPKTVTGAELDLDDAPARESELFIVDGNNLAYRAFFALPERARHHRRAADERTARVHEHVVQAARGLPSEGRRRGVGLAPGARAAIAEAADVVYKQGRKPMPDLLREQFPHFRPIVEAFGYRNLEFEGWEADDVIATLATRADTDGIKTCVVSTDRDAFQLCSDERLPDDDPARRGRRQRLHAGAGRGALRRHAGAGTGLHRPQGRHVRQHPGRPGDRRQDRRPADRAVRVARVRDRACLRALPGSRPQHHRARRAGARVEGAGDDAPRPRHRLRSGPARARAHPIARS